MMCNLDLRILDVGGKTEYCLVQVLAELSDSKHFKPYSSNSKTLPFSIRKFTWFITSLILISLKQSAQP